jgi:hypothetical protein
LSKAADPQSGSALILVMLLIVVLTPLIASVAMQARLDLLIERHGRAAHEAFYVAESGLEHALADLAHDPSFNRLIEGADGKQGTADDRLYPFSHPPPAFFPRPPAGYRVETAPMGAEVVEIISYGHAALRSARVVSATAVKSKDPYLPAATYSAGDGVVLDLGDDFYIDGADASGDDATPAVALDDDADVDVFLQYLSQPARERLRGPGGTPSVTRRRLGSLNSMAAALAKLATTQVPDGEIHGPLGWGVTMSARPTRVSDASGGGILIVDGDLSIGGRFEFDGLVIVRGNVDLDSDGDLELKGALLQDSPGSSLRLRGDGSIRYDPATLALVDALAPDVLPRRAVIGAWRERP